MGVIYYADLDPVFQPAMRLVTNITNDRAAVVTTSFAHGYITGVIVRLYVPQPFGMPQADQLQGSITVLDDYSFSIDIDTSEFDPFIPNLPLMPRYAKIPLVVPIGEVSGMLKAAFRNTL